LLWVVHGDHASIWHCYGDMVPQMLDAQTWTRKERRKKGKRKRKGKGKGEGKGEGKWKKNGEGKRKGKGRWKEESLRKVGQTDARTLRNFIVVCPTGQSF